jgi:hypothetical protein
MIRNKTHDNLNELSDWIKNPINTGSVYIKPTINERSWQDTAYVYFYYFCCCAWLPE